MFPRTVLSAVGFSSGSKNNNRSREASVTFFDFLVHMRSDDFVEHYSSRLARNKIIVNE